MDNAHYTENAQALNPPFLNNAFPSVGHMLDFIIKCKLA
jgi:hypothetical protein